MTPLTQKSQPEVIAPAIWPSWESIIDLPGPEAVSSHWPPLVMDSARSVCGILTGLNSAGVAWLGRWVREDQNRICRFTVTLWPACPTTEANLRYLHALAGELGSRIEFRLFPVNDWAGPPSNVLLVVPENQTEEAVIIVGPAAGWLTDVRRPEQLAFVWRPDSLLLATWRSWFDIFWESAARLDEDTTTLPALEPAPGSSEAAALWDAYVSACNAARRTRQAVSVGPAQLPLDPGLEVERVPEAKPRSVTAEIGLPPHDALREWMARLYSQGALVTIDQAGRLPPFDAPIQPRWFGVESLHQVGAVSRRIQYRISPFDPYTLKRLNNKRNGLSDIIDRFTYSLGHGQRWMPDAARSLFDAERKRIEGEARKVFGREVTGDITGFLAGQRQRILDDADRMFQEFHPGRHIPESAVDEIMQDLARRLDKTTRGNFLPTVAFSIVQPRSASGQAGVSEWTLHLTFLLSLARFLRQLITNVYFLQAVSVDRDELLVAMNIAADLIAENPWASGTYLRAERELERLAQIEESQADERSKCQQIVDLILGDNGS